MSEKTYKNPFTLDGRAREGLEAEVFRRGAEKETRADGVSQAEICFELRGEKPLTARLLLEDAAA